MRSACAVIAHMNTLKTCISNQKPKLIDRSTRDRWNEAGTSTWKSRALIAAKEPRHMGTGTPL